MADRRSSLESVVQTGIDNALKEVHTCLPGLVTKVDHANQLIDAQITIKRQLSDQIVNLPLLVDVPLRFLKSGNFSITIPIEVGDHVLLFFAERSIDTWLINGGLANPFDTRKFSLSDAFALPYMYPQTDLIPNFSSTNLEIKTNSGNANISISPSGDIDITSVSLTHNGVNIGSSHKHTQGNDSDNNVQQDTGVPF